MQKKKEIVSWSLVSLVSLFYLLGFTTMHKKYRYSCISQTIVNAPLTTKAVGSSILDLLLLFDCIFLSAIKWQTMKVNLFRKVQIESVIDCLPSVTWSSEFCSNLLLDSNARLIPIWSAETYQIDLTKGQIRYWNALNIDNLLTINRKPW